MNMRVLLYFFLVVLLIQCETPTDEVEETNSIESYCITGDCIVRLYTEENPDENGYHHIYRTFGGTFPPRFDLNIESSLMKDKYVYNNVYNVFSYFSSKWNYTVDNIVFSLPLYNPFQSLYVYDGMIPIRDTIVTIDYFKGEIYPVVQETRVYHSLKDDVLYSKKIIPLFKEMIGDTMTVYSDTSFDSKIHILDSIKIVIHEN